MSLRHRVVWSQGMFLQPQHFQQEARFVAYLIDARTRCGQPHAWGFDVLVLDEAQLALGHAQDDKALLQARAAVYEQSQQKQLQRCSRKIRNWTFFDTVHLNPDRAQTKEAQAGQKAA